MSATTTTKKAIESLQTERITPEGTTGEGTGYRVEPAALPAPSLRGLAHRGAGRWGLFAGMGVNSLRRERGVFVPAEAVAEYYPLWLGARAQELG